ncbi:transcription elongation factor Spt5 [Tilletiaria anomala UBC 951]|uniref:Transcription elongation factor SPT5 n=1 Tax=Tilletiaria anomala (strain ATCC 24038 / CBS 436.72 / UBC 951) TaxID=1037660 RepID=A0A066VCJ3_TILAU|nr:transcription elongation factor Spt5 [Tilletiaria anomala UBC 951]KDN39452.1 transcription elongation factor Spt5 [Tilletiaria anomala UBC 951]
MSDVEEDARVPSKRNPFIDDEVEEDDDDGESDDDSEDDGGRRRKKRPRNRYIEDEALVDDDDEDLDDEDDGLLQEDGFIAEDLADDGRQTERDNRRLDQLRMAQEGKSAEEVAAELNARYARSRRVTDSDFSQVPQRMLMPSVEDPNIWSVRCKIGREKNIISTIMHKAFRTGQTFGDTSNAGIISAFVRDSIPGRLFVEARKFDAVLEGLKDINGVYTSQPSSIFLVPIDEMADLLKITKVQREIKPGGWVRIKRGRYAGDLAQIIDQSENGEEVGVRFIPRIDLNPREEGTYVDSAGRKRKKSEASGAGQTLAFRPPQRFFNYEEVAKAYRDKPPQPKGLGRYTFKGDDYVQGYCEKDVRLTGLVLEGVNPTLDEISRFMGESSADGIESGRIDFSLLQEATKKENDVLFQPGDHVEVYEGEQAGAKGIVNSLLGRVLLIDLEGEDLEGQRVEVPIQSVRKRFKPGDHIKVISGTHADETGLVVKIEDNVTTFLSDLSLTEVSVFSKDIREAAEVGSGVNVIGDYELHNLVQLDASTAGVIFKIEREMFHVLDQQGQVIAVRPHQISNKRDSSRATAIDSNGNEMKTGDAVREVDGERREGTILHVYQGMLVYLHNRDITDNNGVFIARPKNLAPKFHSGKASTDLSKMNPHRSGNSGPMAMAPPAVTNFSGRGRDPFKGKHVSIIRGPYKTYKGIIKETLGVSARVELQSMAKTLTVELDKMVEIDPQTGARRNKLIGPGSNGSVAGSRQGSFAPSFGGSQRSSSTNMYAASSQLGSAASSGPPGLQPSTAAMMAPGMITARTPAYGGLGDKTPGYAMGGRSMYASDTKTPMYVSSGARTPAYVQGRTPAWSGGAGSRTPAQFSQTPAYGGGRTPGYVMNGAATPYGGNTTPNPYGDRTAGVTSGSAVPGRSYTLETPMVDSGMPGHAESSWTKQPSSALERPLPIAGMRAKIVADRHVPPYRGGEWDDTICSVTAIDEAAKTCTSFTDDGRELKDVPFANVKAERPLLHRLCLVLHGQSRGQRATLKAIDANTDEAMAALTNGATLTLPTVYLAQMA